MTDANEYLFVRSINNSESDDAWDDTELIDTYDNTILILKSEVAKRLAMDTNTKKAKNPKSHKANPNKECEEENGLEKQSTQINKSQDEWNAGDFCRAIFSEDGQEYEAVIEKINLVPDNSAVVRYLGYDNTELQQLSDLLPSWGSIEQQNQLDAMSPLNYSGSAKAEHSYAMSEGSQAVPPKKKTGRRALSMQPPLPQLPSPPFNFPPFMPGLGNDTMMPPPPPMSFLGMAGAGQDGEHDKALHSMLVSWYMTGYYTGLYQGKKAEKQKCNA